MIRAIPLGLAAALALIPYAPARAVPTSYSAKYVGTLNGVVTDGGQTELDYDPDDGFFQVYDPIYTGDDITINFTADVANNYYDASTDTYYPRFVVLDVQVSVKAPPGGFGAVGGATYTNEFDVLNADYTGDAVASHLFGSLFFDANDSDSTSLTFANAKSTLAPLTGSGNWFDGDGEGYNQRATFTLQSGFVRALAAPEPATWMLTIAGMGVVGGMMRRRNGAMRLVPTRI